VTIFVLQSTKSPFQLCAWRNTQKFLLYLQNYRKSKNRTFNQFYLYQISHLPVKANLWKLGFGAAKGKKRRSETPLLPLAYLLNEDCNFAKSILAYLPCELCNTRTARLGCGEGEEMGGFEEMQGRSAGIARDFVNKYLYFLHRSDIFFRTLYV
jgi:hypothetical protein